MDDESEKVVAKCDPWASVLKRKLPRFMFQTSCNYTVFHPETCGAPFYMHETSAQVSAVSLSDRPPTIDVDLLNPSSPRAASWKSADWLAGGKVECGAGASYETRAIIASALVSGDTIRLTLNARLTVAVTDVVTISPGCDGTAETCKTKFNNFARFGGFPSIPNRNLSLKSMDNSVAKGGKK